MSLKVLKSNQVIVPFLRSFSTKQPDYVPPKPPSMRKVVREKENYVRGSYEISNVGFELLKSTEEKIKDKTWYTVYRLPEQDLANFKRNQMMKIWLQVPPFAFFVKFMYAQ